MRPARTRALLAIALVAGAIVGLPQAWAGKVNLFGTAMAAQDCERCNVQAIFAQKMRDAAASIEFLEINNGIGVVYTASDPRDVGRVQRAAEWARDELQRISRDPDAHHLCSYCRATRAVYSKLDREVVRTPQGAIFFMRSSDPEAVRALKDLFVKTQKREVNTPAPTR